MKIPPTDHFIKERAQVDEPHRATAYGPGRRGAPPPFDASRQSLLLMGLPGCGHLEVARLAAARLGMTVQSLAPTPDESGEALTQRAMAAMAAAGVVFVADDRLVTHLDQQALSYLPALPVYCLGTVWHCVRDVRDEETREALRADLAARLDALEAKAMLLGRHILRADEPPARQLGQLLEKLGLAPAEDEPDWDAPDDLEA